MASPSSGSLLPTPWTRGFGEKPLSEALGRAVGNLESVSDKLPVPVSCASPKPILAEGLPACPGAPSLDLRERLRNKMAGKSKRLYLSSSWILYSSFNSRLTCCGKEPQNTDRSQCSGGDSPCLPTAASPFSSCGEKGWHQATVSLYPVPAGAVDRLCPLLAGRDAARLPGRTRPLGGSRELPPIEAEHPHYASDTRLGADTLKSADTLKGQLTCANSLLTAETIYSFNKYC